MSTYVLDRSSGQVVVTVKETGDVVSLYTDIHDTGVTPVTFGDHPGVAGEGGGDQLAFALYYHYTNDKDISLANYQELARHLKHIVPETIEFEDKEVLVIKPN
jgi:hypothetical protein